MIANTLFLRFEAPMQSWGHHESKFVVRRTAEAPTKSGVAGLLCCALGVPRAEAAADWLPQIRTLTMGVRIDVPGVRWWDYHTVGAGMRMPIAEGEGMTKPGAMLTRREYLCDARFVVALQGEPALIDKLSAAVKNPRWALYLGRKCCPPARPVMECEPEEHESLLSALVSRPWQPRQRGDQPPTTVECLLDWSLAEKDTTASPNASVWYDVPLTFEPPSHGARFVIRRRLKVGMNGEVAIARQAAQKPTPGPPRSRADYGNSEYKRVRQERLDRDEHLCVFCKSPATTVQHVTYRHAGGRERCEELRSLCRLCHDAVTMIEYGMGMGLDRIDPEDPRWRDRIIAKRKEIIRWRSLETRRRHLAMDEVE